MTVTISPVTPDFVAEVYDVDLAQNAFARHSRGNQDRVLALRHFDISRATLNARATRRIREELRPNG